MAAGGAKAIAAEKKASKVQDEDGNWITMDQFLAKSKEGGAGKGGRGVKWHTNWYNSNDLTLI